MVNKTKKEKEMLEEKIDKLIVSIEALTAAVSGTNLTINEEQPASKEVKAEPENNHETITIGQLQDMCLAIVRKDRKKKEKIKEIIADHGGELLKDIDEAKLPSVKKALEAL
jgi:hypothetical protein